MTDEIFRLLFETTPHPYLVLRADETFKNTLANVQAIAMQTLSGTADPAGFVEKLTRSSWQGADLATLIKDQLTVDAGDGDNRVSCIGPQVQLEPQTALHLGLELHELGTNARKHGSLSHPRGNLATVWSVITDDGLPELRLRLVESNGPLVAAPAKRGFGSILIERSLQHALGGDARLDFAPFGVICDIRLPLAQQEKGAYAVKLTENSS